MSLVSAAMAWHHSDEGSALHAKRRHTNILLRKVVKMVRFPIEHFLKFNLWQYFLEFQTNHKAKFGTLAEGGWGHHTNLCRTPQHNTTQHNTTQHNTTQHNTTQHNTTQHNTTQHNTTQHNTTQHSTAQHSTAQRNAAQRNTTQHSTAQHSTAQRNATQRNTTQHNTTKHNTIQHDTTHHTTAQHTEYSPALPMGWVPGAKPRTTGPGCHPMGGVLTVSGVRTPQCQTPAPGIPRPP